MLGHEPRVRTATHDGQRVLGHDGDAKRVRKRPVHPNGAHGRERQEPPAQLVLVERDQALSDVGLRGGLDGAPHGRRHARHLQAPAGRRPRSRARRGRAGRYPRRCSRRSTRVRADGARRRPPNPFAGTRERCGRRTTQSSSPRSHAVLPGGYVESSGGISIAPRSCTSGWRCTPNCSRARRRASTISSTASDDVAPPAFSMKFACFGEICAPPIRWPRSAALLEHPPGGQLVLGILEDAPERPLVRGLGVLAPRLHLGDRRLDLCERPRLEREARRAPRPARAAGRTSGTRAPAPSGVSQRVPSASATSARSSTPAMSPP